MGTKGGSFLYFYIWPVATINASYCSVFRMDLFRVHFGKEYEKHVPYTEHEIVCIIKIEISAFAKLFEYLWLL